VTRTTSIALVCLLVFGGCTSEAVDEDVEPTARHRIVLGLIPERNLFNQLDRYEPLADYLSRRSGIDIELKVVSTYGNLIDDFISSGLDGGFMGSFLLALAHERLGVEPLARPVGLDESSTYYGLVFVRKDSGIRLYRDLMGKRFAFVDPATMAGYLLPLKFFHDFGIRDYRTVFSSSYFAGTHEGAIRDVLNGTADIGAAKSTVFGQLAREDPRIGSELIFLAKSPEVPANSLALRGDLDPEIRTALEQSLLGMQDDPEGQEVLRRFGALRFIETHLDEYATVFDYAAEVGLDLATYDYTDPR
jgi:phosphonate transport system substrate-binding protein